MKLSFGASKVKPQVTDARPSDGPAVVDITESQPDRNSKKRSQEQISSSQAEEPVSRPNTDQNDSSSPAKSKTESPSKRQSSFLAKAGESKNMGTKRLKRNDEDSSKKGESVDEVIRETTEERPQTSGTGSKVTSGTSSKLPAEVNAPLKDYEKLKIHSDPNFCPEKDSPQQKNQRMPFSFVVKALQLIEQTEGKNSRTVIVEIMTNVFRSALVNFPSELPDIFYFFIVKLAPDFEAMETGVGHEVSVKAIAKATGKTPKEIRTLYQEEGDLGSVAQKGKSTQGTLGGFFVKKAADGPKKSLTFTHVFSEFRKIAKTSGDKSALTKENIIVKLIQDSSNDEAKYIIRFLQKTLKTGAAEKTVITALARAIAYTPPNKPGLLNQKKKLGDENFFKLCDDIEYSIKQAICEFPNYGLVILELMKCGDQHQNLKDTCHIRVGIPVKPMLAKPTKGVHIILKRFEGIEFTCEYKYDGFRGQIHFDSSQEKGKDCHIYSRNLENMSQAYPDVLDIIRELAASKPSLTNFILDAELVAFDVEQSIILPF